MTTCRHILFMDLMPYTCPSTHPGRLEALMSGLLQAGPMRLHTLRHYPPQRSTPTPDLLLLRPSAPEDFAAMVPPLRRRWYRLPILGLVCTARETPAALSPAWLSDLDDFLCCPFRAIDLCPRVERLLQGEAMTTAASQSMAGETAFHDEGLVGECEAFLQVLQKIPKLAQSDATVLLSGETGTGKEVVARAIHYHSARQAKPFVPVNCGALPEHLLENELFGHAKGAFTDASSAEKGLLAEAEGGTLFLDEVDSLSSSAQVKLLRVLQDREYRPLGSATSMMADVRIIAATNIDLTQEVQAKRLRADLYHRLNVLSLHLPPLRDRLADIPRLARHALVRYGRQNGGRARRLSAGAVQKLLAYDWPGNVRELEGVIQRAVILTTSPVLQPEDLELPEPSRHELSPHGSLREAKARALQQVERRYLIDCLVAHGGNITRAAKQAGTDRRAFQRLLRKYGLDRRAFQA